MNKPDPTSFMLLQQMSMQSSVMVEAVHNQMVIDDFMTQPEMTDLLLQATNYLSAAQIAFTKAQKKLGAYNP